MRNFLCDCGQQVYLYNSKCLACNHLLGFDVSSMRVVSLSPVAHDLWKSATGLVFRLCQNRVNHDVCNWLRPEQQGPGFCLACGLNRTIPSLSSPLRIELWGHLEMAKRHLIYNLLSLGLPVVGKAEQQETGLAFDFLEDRSRNPGVAEDSVTTGHRSGVITINLAEADELHREQIRITLGEAYRTLLGHLRHESGHYYFDRLIRNGEHLSSFRKLFGSEEIDYQQSMDYHYRSIDRGLSESDTWQDGYISAYAQAHPLEDWAESWSHYMHIADTCDTAAEFGLIPRDVLSLDFPDWLDHWARVTTTMNALTRSLGLKDVYPFILTPCVITKIHYVHKIIHNGFGTAESGK